MKFSIGLFGVIDLDFILKKNELNRWSISGFFPTFPNRPGNPHISIFADARKPIHFTGRIEKSQPFRRYLTTKSNKMLQARLKHLSEELASRSVAQLQKIDLGAFEAEGWLIHWVNQTAVARWVKLAVGEKTRIDVTKEHLATFLRHFFSNVEKPSNLSQIASHFCIIAVRETLESIETTMLMYIPKGIESSNLSPGWYRQKKLDLDPYSVHLANQDIQFDRVVSEIKQYLTQFPRANNEIQQWLKEFPPSLAFIIGFHSMDILRILFNSAVTSHLRRTLKTPAIDFNS